MRCLSCQRQSFQTWSGRSTQKPRPAGRNSLRAWSGGHDGGSSPLSEAVSFIAGELYFGVFVCQVTGRNEPALEGDVHFLVPGKALASVGFGAPKWMRAWSSSFSLFTMSPTK